MGRARKAKDTIDEDIIDDELDDLEGMLDGDDDAEAEEYKHPEDTEFIRTSTSIDHLNLNEEFIRVPGDVAYWGEQHAKAIRAHHEAKNAEEEVRAGLWEQAKMRAEAGSKTKPTQKDISSIIDRQDAMKEAKAQVILTEFRKECVKGWLDAVRAKREMLVTIGANMREEMRHDLKVRE